MVATLMGCGSSSSDPAGGSGGTRGTGSFYTQTLDCIGLTIGASDEVDPSSLQRMCEVVEEVLTPMPSILATLQRQNVLLAIYGFGERGTTTPESRELLGDIIGTTCGAAPSQGAASAPGARPYMQASENSVHCVAGPRMTTALGDVVLHELAHMVHQHALYADGRTLYDRIAEIYGAAMQAGRWSETYAATNEFEFFARMVERYFNTTPEFFGHATTRDELAEYEPDIFALIQELFGTQELETSCAAELIRLDNDEVEPPWRLADGNYDREHPTATQDGNPPGDPLIAFCERIIDCEACNDTEGVEGCLRSYDNIRVEAGAFDVPDPTLELGPCAEEETCFGAQACKNRIMYGEYPWVDWR
jgi:hypothetical protein